LKRLFGARDEADLGWVPGIGALPETGTAPAVEPLSEMATPTVTAPAGETETTIPAEVIVAAPMTPAPAAPEPEPEPEPEIGIPPATVTAAVPIFDLQPDLRPDLRPPPTAETPPAEVLFPLGAAPAAKGGLFKRIFHRTEEGAGPVEAVPSGPPALNKFWHDEDLGPVEAVPSGPPAPRASPAEIVVRDQPVDWESPEVRRGLFKRLTERLSRSRTQLGSGLGTLFLGRKKIDDDLMEELETLLLTADVGVEATTRIIEDLTRRVKRKALADPQALLAALKDELRQILTAAQAPVRQAAPDRPQVVLMVGVNGAGKTTTIGKLARLLQAEGNSVMLAAGDTFRAAAVEQLEAWGERNRVPVIAQHTGADSASVIFDALQAATARGVDVLIADTAGRLHTKTNLMDELSKVARVMRKIDPEAPHEVLLVVDATTGQNGLNQAVQFHLAVPLTGIALTKLDGTAKGGIVFAIAERLKVPIRFIGVGESIEDLRPFDADEFLDALLGQ
jgi:fused signal recognition particle receptor